MQTLPPLRIALASLALSAVACGKDGGDSGAAEPDGMSADDQAMAEALWAEIGGYESWSQLDPWVGIVASTDVHGDYVQIWANGAVADTIAVGGGGDMPDGAITVKEGYSDESGTSVNAITVMKKVAGYDAANGDWFYARYDAAGTVTAAGQSAVAGCAGCHSSGQDSVRSWTW